MNTFRKLSFVLAAVAIFASILACGSSTPGVSNIYMANDVDGKNKTTTFAPTDTVYVFFDVNSVDAGTVFHIKWYILDMEGQDANTPVATTDYTYNNDATIYGHISQDSGLPTGKYKVEIYMGDTKAGEAEFSVQ